MTFILTAQTVKYVIYILLITLYYVNIHARSNFTVAVGRWKN